jgi:hypothetical protein
MPRFAFLAFTLLLVMTMPAMADDHPLPSNKRLGTVFNNDSNNIIWCMGKAKNDFTPEVYRQYLNRLLDGKPGVLAQCVGFPETVYYPTKAGTCVTKHFDEVCRETWPENEQSTYSDQTVVLKKLFDAGSDPLQITIEECRKRGVPVLASFRMNSEDFYANSYKLSDFGRAYPEYRIPGGGCLDWAVPAVYEHRMKIFAEAVERYDIDGLELDFRRWYRMISNPAENHVVLTRLVGDVRKLLDDAARRKGRKRLMLGVRVGPMLEGKFVKADFPGSQYVEPMNASCKTLGLDVKTWVEKQLVDYLSPMLFEPTGLPKTKEFVELASGTGIGVYPTLSYIPCGSLGGPAIAGQADNEKNRRLYRDDVCREALKCYADGADGISVFNWFMYNCPPPGGSGPEWVNNTSGTLGDYARGVFWVQQEVLPKLSKPAALQALIEQQR